MKKTNFLMTTLMSTLLLSSTISAHSMQCKDGKCFIDISKLSKPTSSESKLNKFKSLKIEHFTSNVPKTILPHPSNTIVLDHSKYVMSEDERNNYLAEDITEDTIVLAHSKYVMNEKEKKDYYRNERLKKLELEKELIVPILTVEDKISDEIILPHSELYCDNDKQAKFHPDTNYYECV